MKKNQNHIERLSIKINQQKHREEINQIIIKNKIINNNNNHYYNLQVQKPYTNQRMTLINTDKFIYDPNFKNSTNESTPIYKNIKEQNKFIYEDYSQGGKMKIKKKSILKKNKLIKGTQTDSKLN